MTPVRLGAKLTTSAPVVEFASSIALRSVPAVSAAASEMTLNVGGTVPSSRKSMTRERFRMDEASFPCLLKIAGFGAHSRPQPTHNLHFRQCGRTTEVESTEISGDGG